VSPSDHVVHSRGMPQSSGTPSEVCTRINEPGIANGDGSVTLSAGRLSSALAVSPEEPIATSVPPPRTNASVSQPAWPAPRAQWTRSGTLFGFSPLTIRDCEMPSGIRIVS
jgi:hypothetical protein